MAGIYALGSSPILYSVYLVLIELFDIHSSPKCFLRSVSFSSFSNHNFYRITLGCRLNARTILRTKHNEAVTLGGTAFSENSTLPGSHEVHKVIVSLVFLKCYSKNTKGTDSRWERYWNDRRCGSWCKCIFLFLLQQKVTSAHVYNMSCRRVSHLKARELPWSQYLHIAIPLQRARWV